MRETCSAYIDDVNGCTGWSTQFCGSATGLDMGCAGRNGENTATACAGAAVTMDFDTGLARIANNAGDFAECTMTADDAGTYPARTSCEM